MYIKEISIHKPPLTREELDALKPLYIKEYTRTQLLFDYCMLIASAELLKLFANTTPATLAAILIPTVFFLAWSITRFNRAAASKTAFEEISAALQDDDLRFAKQLKRQKHVQYIEEVMKLNRCVTFYELDMLNGLGRHRHLNA